jgi:cytochrome bd-type quinol oxidase subunit 2
MLAIEADAISHEALHSSLAILEREMNVVLMYLANVGTQAALIAGFVFVIFYDGPDFTDEESVHPVAAGFSMAATVVCFSAMIFTVVCSTVSSSLGPQMALKGTDTSAMRRAVDCMKQDRRQIVTAFAIGVVAFYIVCFVLLWVKLMSQTWNAIICSLILIIGFCFLVCAWRRMARQYALDDKQSSTFFPSIMTGRRSRPDGGDKVSGREYVKRAKEMQRAAERGGIPSVAGNV